jgi:hypothetical protein
LDLDDPQSIFAFTSRYGPLGGADAYAAIPLETDPFFATLYGGHLDLENERAKKRRALWREVTRADPSLADREPVDKTALRPCRPSAKERHQRTFGRGTMPQSG